MITDIQVLTQLATAALSSPDKDMREDAASKLRCLNSYDNFETVKELLPRVMNDSLRFILLEAIRFIVSNEIGPHERSEMIDYIIAYIDNCKKQGIFLPPLIMRRLYLIYASALFLNWKLYIITMEQENGTTEKLGEEIISKLSAVLTPLEMMECIDVTLTHFSNEDHRSVMSSVRSVFTNDVLPFFFRLAASEIANHGKPALQLCIVVLESIPSSRVSTLFSLRLTTDETIQISNSSVWFPALPLCVMQCGGAVLQDGTPPLFALECLKFLRLASTIMQIDQKDFNAHNSLYDSLIDLTEQILIQCNFKWNSATLHCACAILVNMFERDEGKIATYLYSKPEIVEQWCTLSTAAFRRWEEDEEELRNDLLHLFYLIGDRAIPTSSLSRVPHIKDFLEMPLVLDSPPLQGREITRPPSPRRLTPHTSPMQTRYNGGQEGEDNDVPAFLDARNEGRQHLGNTIEDERSARLKQALLTVFHSYIELVIEKAPLSEDSAEVRRDMTVLLNIERCVQPIAELLFCTTVDLSSTIEKLLHDSIEEYDLCVRARRGETNDQDRLLALASRTDNSLISSLGAENTILYLARVCLSRLSVVISIAALALRNSTVLPSQHLISGIATLGRKLLSDDDALTDALLQCLNIGGGNGGMLGGGQQPEQSIHIGVLRAFYFFGNCVSQSDFGDDTTFYHILLDLLKFTIVRHNDIVCLVSDANQLLMEMLKRGVSSCRFLGSDEMLTCVKALLENKVGLIRYGGNRLSEDELVARRGLLTAFTFLIECRYYAGYSTPASVTRFLDEILSEQNLLTSPELVFEDLLAITEGIHQAEPLWWVLESVVNAKKQILSAFLTNAGIAPHMLRLWSKLTTLASNLLGEDFINDTKWEFASFVLNMISYYFNFLNVSEGRFSNSRDNTITSNVPNVTRQFLAFSQDAVGEDVVFSISTIIHSFCARTWINLGVLSLYEDSRVEYILCGSLELLTSTSMQLIMSNNEGRREVFVAMLCALDLRSEVGVRTHQMMCNCNLWSRLVHYMTRCLSHCYLPEVMDCIHTVLRELPTSDLKVFQGIDKYYNTSQSDSQWVRTSSSRLGRNHRLLLQAQQTGGYRELSPQSLGVSVAENHELSSGGSKSKMALVSPVSISEDVILETFREVAILVSTIPSLEESQLRTCFEVIAMCFSNLPEGCTATMEELLDFCSAYHRVRLRCILMMLRNDNSNDMTHSYTSVFGLGSKVGKLSAW